MSAAAADAPRSPVPGSAISALSLSGIVKRFGRTAALDGASLDVRAGTVHALLGENGAGKTTLMRIAYGMLRPDAGALAVSGRAVHFRAPSDAIASGLGMVHQHFTNVAAMTIAENVTLGGRGLYHQRAAAELVREIGERTGLQLDPLARAGELGVGAQQRLEIVKALARDARILVLDEPTAVLAPSEARDLLAWLRQFARDGRTVVLITHKLREALDVADDVTVLRRGHTVLAQPTSLATESSVTLAMLGEAPPAAPHPTADVQREVALRLEHVSITGSREEIGRGLDDVTLHVRSGEVLGVAGVENSGHHVLLRALAGRARATAGEIWAAGPVAFVPEDRQRDALVLDFTLMENVALKGAGARRGRMRWPAWRRLTSQLVRDFDVRASGVDAPARSLSGGNQQKLVLARELDGAPVAVVAENPTRGLDVRSSAAVHAKLREAAAKGMAVVVYSADLDEVLALATRVVAVHAGRVLDVPRDREVVGRAMLGAG